MNQVHCLGSVQEFGIWKIEIRDKKCVTLLQGSEMSVGLHFMSLIIGFCSGGMAAVAVAISVICGLMVSTTKPNCRGAVQPPGEQNTHPPIFLIL